MATDKARLFVRVSPDLRDRLKKLHLTDARTRHKTGNRITFSSWIEEILADYIGGIDAHRKANDNPDSLDYSEFE